MTKVMRKPKFNLLLSVAVALIFALSMSIIACSGKGGTSGGGGDTPTDPVEITVSYNEETGIASWDAVEGATSYSVGVTLAGGSATSETTAQTSMQLYLLSGMNVISVRALRGDTELGTGILRVTLTRDFGAPAAPTGLSYDGQKLTWTASENAAKYNITVSSLTDITLSVSTSVTTNSYELDRAIGIYDFTVQAESSIGKKSEAVPYSWWSQTQIPGWDTPIAQSDRIKLLDFEDDRVLELMGASIWKGWDSASVSTDATAALVNDISGSDSKVLEIDAPATVDTRFFGSTLYLPEPVPTFGMMYIDVMRTSGDGFAIVFWDEDGNSAAISRDYSYSEFYEKWSELAISYDELMEKTPYLGEIVAITFSSYNGKRGQYYFDNLEYTVLGPIGELEYDYANQTLNWTAVTNAESYSLIIDGGNPITGITTNSYKPSTALSDGAHTVELTAHYGATSRVKSFDIYVLDWDAELDSFGKETEADSGEYIIADWSELLYIKYLSAYNAGNAPSDYRVNTAGGSIEIDFKKDWSTGTLYYEFPQSLDVAKLLTVKFYDVTSATCAYLVFEDGNRYLDLTEQLGTEPQYLEREKGNGLSGTTVTDKGYVIVKLTQDSLYSNNGSSYAKGNRYAGGKLKGILFGITKIVEGYENKTFGKITYTLAEETTPATVTYNGGELTTVAPGVFDYGKLSFTGAEGVTYDAIILNSSGTLVAKDAALISGNYTLVVGAQGNYYAETKIEFGVVAKNIDDETDLTFTYDGGDVESYTHYSNELFDLSKFASSNGEINFTYSISKDGSNYDSSDYLEAGEYTVTATASGAYKGSATFTFTVADPQTVSVELKYDGSTDITGMIVNDMIERSKLSATVADPSDWNYTYSILAPGASVAVEITSDYSLSIAGTYKLIVTGFKHGYSCTAYIEFTVDPVDEVFPTSITYDGNEVKDKKITVTQFETLNTNKFSVVFDQQVDSIVKIVVDGDDHNTDSILLDILTEGYYQVVITVTTRGFSGVTVINVEVTMAQISNFDSVRQDGNKQLADWSELAYVNYLSTEVNNVDHDVNPRIDTSANKLTADLWNGKANMIYTFPHELPFDSINKLYFKNMNAGIVARLLFTDGTNLYLPLSCWQDDAYKAWISNGWVNDETYNPVVFLISCPTRSDYLGKMIKGIKFEYVNNGSAAIARSFGEIYYTAVPTTFNKETSAGSGEYILTDWSDQTYRRYVTPNQSAPSTFTIADGKLTATYATAWSNGTLNYAFPEPIDISRIATITFYDVTSVNALGYLVASDGSKRNMYFGDSSYDWIVQSPGSTEGVSTFTINLVESEEKIFTGFAGDSRTAGYKLTNIWLGTIAANKTMSFGMITYTLYQGA